MKRLLTTLSLLTGAIFAFVPANLLAQSPEAVIREISGTVELKKPGSADWTSAIPGEFIESATLVSTGFRSSAVIAVGNSTLLVRPVTSLSLEDLLSHDESETVNINLRTGRVRVDVTPPAGQRSNFTVQTPTATAAVRGTSFEMDTTSIRVLEGTVSYAPVAAISARPVRVSAGQESWVNTDTGGAINPMTASEESRTLPSLPGQNAGTLPTDNARLAVPGMSGETGSSSLVIDVIYIH